MVLGTSHSRISKSLVVGFGEILQAKGAVCDPGRPARMPEIAGAGISTSRRPHHCQRGLTPAVEGRAPQLRWQIGLALIVTTRIDQTARMVADAHAALRVGTQCPSLAETTCSTGYRPLGMSETIREVGEATTLLEETTLSLLAAAMTGKADQGTTIGEIISSKAIATRQGIKVGTGSQIMEAGTEVDTLDVAAELAFSVTQMQCHNRSRMQVLLVWAGLYRLHRLLCHLSTPSPRSHRKRKPGLAQGWLARRHAVGRAGAELCQPDL